MKRIESLLAAGLFTLLICTWSTQAFAARVKDIARIQGVRAHMLVGYGLVTGLSGTGDSSGNRATRQSIANLLGQFSVTVPPEAITSRNAAAVMVTANMPAFSRIGDAIDVTVTSLADARSLEGGALLLAPLKGPDGRTYVLAQGALTVGGYKYDANGSVGQKNYPTVATIPAGGIVEVQLAAPSVTRDESFTISLLEADYTNAARVAEVINGSLQGAYAQATDPDGITVQVPPAFRGRFAELVRQIEALDVRVDFTARVVVSERTGTVVSGSNVQVSPVAISYGDLRVSIVTDNAVSQPSGVAFAPVFTPGVRSESYSNSRIEVEERAGAALITEPGGTIADLVQALARLKTNSRDVVSILKALKSAGALHAELIVQ